MLYILILAGGPGTRLWPLCRTNHPKQFLKIPGDKSLLEQAVERARALVPDENIFIATRASYRDQVYAELPDFPRDQVFLEPYRRDTGPAVAMVVRYLMEIDPEATLAVLTSDHHISDVDAFTQCISIGSGLAEEHNLPVTFGIAPYRPETAFGYLQVGEIHKEGPPKVYSLMAFKEKPDLATAEKYLAAGNYFWNSGMFVWKISNIANLFQKHTPAIWRGMEAIRKVGFDLEKMASIYASLPALSVDFAVMEHVKEGFVIEATFGWEDIGSWRAFADLRRHDDNYNASSGLLVARDTSGCLFEVGNKVVAAIGVNDLVVVDTPDAILICPKERDQEVKELLKDLEKMGKSEVL